MAKLMCFGRVTADLELRESVRKEPYVRFSLAENLGYGETARTQYYQVWAWGHLAKNLVKRCSLCEIISWWGSSTTAWQI